MTNTVVIRGFGPHVRFKTRGTDHSVRVVTSNAVKTVPLVTPTTDIKYRAA